MTIANYQFLPWTRRGLVAEIRQPDADILPARATIKVAVTLNETIISSPALSLYGPGDVVGVDPRLIVRVTPSANSTNVEPNYFPAIDFDPPDFPWLFTPAKAGDKERLRPWLVLVIIDQSVVNRPATFPGALLPVLTVPASVVGKELPDLSESWAWAHTQMLTPQGHADLAGALAAQPDLNVSRLLCPRHLEPNKQYYACLVPAFDLGVQRGLGGEPAVDAPLRPAWDVNNPTDLRLPLYYHWEFATGALGDFESLARKLKPFVCPPTIGFARMSVGAAGAELPAIAPTDPSALVWMDGALRAPNAPAQPGAEADVPHLAQLADIPDAIQQALRQTLNAPANQIQTGATDATPALGPPIYGGWHLNQHSVADPSLAWFYELNSDLRSRVAAGLGAEVVRKNQEDFMQVCWEQVGKILQANELLNRARFSMTVARSMYQRHYQPLPMDRFLQVTAPIHARILEGDVTIRAGISRTSLPDAALDPALRRLSSPQRPLFKALARRELSQTAFRSQLVSTLAAGRTDVDPNQFVPDGLLEVKALATIVQPADLQASVSLAAIGLPIEIPATALQSLRTQSAEVKAIPATRALSVRENLRTAGLLTSVHLSSLTTLEAAQGVGTRLNLNQVMTNLIEANQVNPGATAFLVSQNANATSSIQVLDVNTKGQVLVRTPLNQAAVPIATIDPALFASHRQDMSNLLVELQVNVLDGSGQRPIKILPGLVRRATVQLPPLRQGQGQMLGPLLGNQVPTNRVPIEHVPIGDRVVMSKALPPLVKDISTINRFKTAVSALAEKVQIQILPPVAVLVSYALPAPTQTLLTRLNPTRTVPNRVLSMLTASDSLRDRLREILDPIMPAPDLPAPIYSYLSKYDQTRFLPGIDQIPNNSMTLLETNPRFVEAFLIGLNHEMNRELLWRDFPTDQRGTPFRHFWAWADGTPDIDPIHTWNQNAALGSQTRGAGQGGQLVLLVRGEVLFRYPNSIVYAWRAEPDPTRPGKMRLKKEPVPKLDLRRPVFAGQFSQDYTLAGFDLTDREVVDGAGWYFVLEEQPTEPRFGLDEPGSPSSRKRKNIAANDLSWDSVNTLPGSHLVIAKNGLENRPFENAIFGKNSAHLARLTLQKPMRVAIHARSILEPTTPPSTRIFPEVRYVNL